MENTTETNAPQQGVVDKTVTLILSKTIKGKPVLHNPKAVFNYHWDDSKNMGQAILQTLDGTTLNIPLYPLGIAGRLGFMSDMPPTPYPVDGKNVIINRVILNVFPDQVTAAIMFNQDGSAIQASPNWGDDDKSYDEAPPKHS